MTKIVRSEPGMNRVIEIRSYNLKPGTREQFSRVVNEEAIPMLREWGVDVVAFGPSPHDDISFYLIRAYKSLAHRQSSQDEFYGSKQWREGPRERVLAHIDSYTSVVLPVTEEIIDGLRQRPSGVA